MPTVASIRQMDLFLPLPLGADAVNRRGDENYNLMARLKDGVTMEQADADVGGDCRADPRQGQARSHLHDRRRAAARSGRRERPPRGAGAARVGDAGAAHRLRERRQSAADARHGAAEGSRDPDRARRGLAAAGAPAADRERAARPDRAARSVCSIAKAALVRGAHRESRQHSAARRDRHRRPGAGVHVRGLDPDRDRVRAGAGLPRRAARSEHRAQGRRPEQPGRGRLRQLAAPAAQPAGRGGGGAVADAAGRRRAADSQLRAAAAGHARLQSRRA